MIVTHLLILCPGLAGFADYLFSFVPYTFTLIGLWWAEPSDNCSDLTHFLTINTLNADLCRTICCDLYTLGHCVFDRIGIAEVKNKFFPLDLGSVANSDNLKIPLEARRNSSYHVINQSPYHTVKSFCPLFIIISGELYFCFSNFQIDTWYCRGAQFTFRPLGY